MCLPADVDGEYDPDEDGGGGGGGEDGAGGGGELRIDASDGYAYPKESFIEAYGGTDEWECSLRPQ